MKKSKELHKLLSRHAGFWRKEKAARPLMRVSDFRPLKKGGSDWHALQSLPEGRLINPVEIPGQSLVGAKPAVVLDGDFIGGAKVTGLCWTEAMIGCPIRMGAGGPWAQNYLVDKREIKARLAAGKPGDDSPWLAIFRDATRLTCRHAAGSYPIDQPLMRGPLDMMASALGHERMVTSFFDNPQEAGALLDLCADIFINLVNVHFGLVPPFESGYLSYGIWAPGPVVRTQLDNAVLLSPRLYRQHFLPRDRRVFAAFDRVVIHVHSGALHIAESLIEQPELDAVQVSLDFPGGPRVAEVMRILKIVNERKPLILTGPVTDSELSLLLENLDPDGLALDLQKIGG